MPDHDPLVVTVEPSLIRPSGGFLCWLTVYELRGASVRCVGGAPSFPGAPVARSQPPRGAAIGLGAGKRSVGDVRNSRLRSRLTRRRFTLAKFVSNESSTGLLFLHYRPRTCSQASVTERPIALPAALGREAHHEATPF